MKKIIITIACAAIAPFAIAQTTSTTSETTTQSQGGVVSQTNTTTTTSVDGTVTTFQPGQTIVVRQAGVTDPVSYVLGKTVQYVNRAGRTIEASMIHPGVPVHVYYDNAGSTRTVTKVVVDQD
jgi:hypothetical protein